MNSELLGLLQQDIYTDAPEYADRVRRVRELLTREKPDDNPVADSACCTKIRYTHGGRVPEQCGEIADPEQICGCGEARCEDHTDLAFFNLGDGRMICENCRISCRNEVLDTVGRIVPCGTVETEEGVLIICGDCKLRLEV